MNIDQVTFSSGGLSLVGTVYVPEGKGPLPAVVVCHPHPQYGGSMDNNVVNSICEALTPLSVMALKFNFRGVEGSEGSFGEGIGEQDDVLAAVEFMAGLKKADPLRLGIAGYSAGSAWGLNAGCQEKRVKALAAVSPPLSMFNFKCLQDCVKPKFMISGSADELIPIKPFLSFCKSLPDPKEYLAIEGAQHSWWGYETVVAGKVSDFFARVL